MKSKSINKISKRNKRKTYRKSKSEKKGQKYKMAKMYGGFAQTEAKSLGDAANGKKNVGKQMLKPEEKQQVEEKLRELMNTNKIGKEAYDYAMAQINNSNGWSGIKDSMVSMLSPVQNMIKVMGDKLVTMPGDYPAQKSLVKLIWFPKMYKQFVKGSLPEKNAKDVEMDEFMVVVKNSFSNPVDKLVSDLNSVDNLLANVINGCVGEGCKSGVVKPEPAFEKTIEVTNNIHKKEVLKNLKDSYEADKNEY